MAAESGAAKIVTANTVAADSDPRVLALKGASGEAARQVLAEVAARLRARGVRVAGVIEIPATADSGPCGHLALRDLASGTVFSISQDLGTGSTACNLDSGGLAGACAAVERAIAAGADLVILSKFGKQEVARSGLSDAFRAAILAGVPVLTSVSPAAAEGWTAFAGTMAGSIAADAAAIETWWRERFPLSDTSRAH